MGNFLQILQKLYNPNAIGDSFIYDFYTFQQIFQIVIFVYFTKIYFNKKRKQLLFDNESDISITN